MTSAALDTGWMSALADVLDPPAPRAELADPVALALHCDPTYSVRSHLRLIGKAIDDLYVGEQYDRLSINTPPRVGKSTTAVEWAAFWWLIKNPLAKIIMASYGDDLALKRGRNVQRLVRRYGPAFGLAIEAGHAAKKDWSLTSGGGVRSVGMGSGITGHDADVIFIDDPVRSRADANSLRKRDQAEDWYSADLSSRLLPGGKMVLVCTPWHEDDLRGRILEREKGRWHTIVLPAIATAEDDPLGRMPGEPLPHPKIPDGDVIRLIAHWERIRSTALPRDWIALYQCDPKPVEGALLSYVTLRERRCFERPDRPCCTERRRACVAVDPSGGGRDTAGIIGAYLGEDSLLYYVADRSGVMGPEQWAREACIMAVEIGADTIVFENNYGGDMGRLAIRTAWDALAREDPARFSPTMPPHIKAVRAKHGKQVRAEPVAQQWIEGRCWTAAYLPEFEAEWATWRSGDIDSPGRLDASVWAAFEMLSAPIVPAEDSGLAQLMLGASLMDRGPGRR